MVNYGSGDGSWWCLSFTGVWHAAHVGALPPDSLGAVSHHLFNDRGDEWRGLFAGLV